MKRTPDVFHELDKVIANYIGNCYCEIAISPFNVLVFRMSVEFVLPEVAQWDTAE